MQREQCFLLSSTSDVPVPLLNTELQRLVLTAGWFYVSTNQASQHFEICRSVSAVFYLFIS